LTCALSGPASSSGSCNPPAGDKTASQSGAFYCTLADGSYTFTVTLTLTNGSIVSATRAFTIPAGNGGQIGADGCSYTESTDITGHTVTSQTEFSIGAGASNGSASGSFAVQTSGCLTNGVFNSSCSGPDKTLYQLAYNNVNVECLSADASTGTIWFSGRVVAGDDLRLPAEQRQQQQSIIAAGNLILVGRFTDQNHDGIADNRSLFLSMATTGYPNALLQSGDNGTITNPWFLQPIADAAGGSLTAANACLTHDNAYLQADYKVVNGPLNQVQWLQLDDVTTVGNPITGTASNLANPPPASSYSLAAVNRTLLSPTLFMPGL